MIRLLGSNHLRGTTVAIDDGGRRLSRYFLTQLTINTAFGIVVGAGLLIIGLPNPVLWGILSALLRFVPYVGSLISAVLPVALATAVDPGWAMGFCCIILRWSACHLREDEMTSQAATWNSPAMNCAWALMSLPPMF